MTLCPSEEQREKLCSEAMGPSPQAWGNSVTFPECRVTLGPYAPSLLSSVREQAERNCRRGVEAFLHVTGRADGRSVGKCCVQGPHGSCRGECEAAGLPALPLLLGGVSCLMVMRHSTALMLCTPCREVTWTTSLSPATTDWFRWVPRRKM